LNQGNPVDEQIPSRSFAMASNVPISLRDSDELRKKE
jgi:hypothetical protein